MLSENTLIYNILAITSVFLSALFIMALRGLKRPTLFLVLARLCTSFMLILNIFQTFNTSFYGQVLWNPLHLLCSLSVFPLLFAYMFSLMHPESLRLKYWLAIYFPLVILVVLHLVFSFVRGSLPVIGNYAQVNAHINEPELWIRFVGTCLFITEMGVFAVITFRMQRQHEQNLQSDFSYTEGSTLGWIRWNIVIILLKALFAVLIMSVEGRIIKSITSILFIVEPLITTILVLRQNDLYKQPSHKSNIGEEDVNPNGNAYIEQPLQKREQIKQVLLQLLDKDEIFKDSELNSEKVQEMLGTNRTYLSQIINQELNTTFYNLINNYRLKKAEEMMKNPLYQHLQLKNIAEICGFKSLGAFSTLFKQTYGKSPSEWRKLK